MASLFAFPAAESLRNWSLHLGGVGLILLGLADNTPFVSAPPGSMDLAVIAFAANRPEWWAEYAFLATAGEVLGGYLTYRLAEKGGKETLERKIGPSRAAKLYKRFEKRGFGPVLAGAILPPPFPFTSVVMAAGIVHFPAKRFLSALAAGRAVRFFAVAFLARAYSRPMVAFLTRYERPMLYVLVATAVVTSIGGAVYFKWSRGTSRRPQPRA